MKKMILVLLSFANVLFANDSILTQGNIKLLLADIDGYAMTIPETDRNGVFRSPDRIEQILNSILRMKHLVNYANVKNLINNKEINESVEFELIKKFKNNENIKRTMHQELEFGKIRNYITLKQQYSYIKKQLLANAIKEEDVLELAEEEYEINKNSHTIVAFKELSFISIIYDETNKANQLIKAKRILADLQNIDFTKYSNDLNYTQADIEVSQEPTKFVYSKDNPKFSDYIFKNKSDGLINDILDRNFRFNIFFINKSAEKQIIPFGKVKAQIVKKLLKLRSERYFSNLIASLTQDPVEINQELLASLKTRYRVK